VGANPPFGDSFHEIFLDFNGSMDAPRLAPSIIGCCMTDSPAHSEHKTLQRSGGAFKQDTATKANGCLDDCGSEASTCDVECNDSDEDACTPVGEYFSLHKRPSARECRLVRERVQELEHHSCEARDHTQRLVHVQCVDLDEIASTPVGQYQSLLKRSSARECRSVHKRLQELEQECVHKQRLPDCYGRSEAVLGTHMSSTAPDCLVRWTDEGVQMQRLPLRVVHRS